MSPRKPDIKAGCREWSSRIPSLLNRPPQDEVRREWERHAEQCPACQAELVEDANLRAMFQRTFDNRPAWVSAAVMDRIRASARPIPLFRRRDVGWSLAGVVAGVLLGLTLAGVMPDLGATANSVDAYAGILSDLSEETLPYWTEFYVDTESAVESTGDSAQ